MPVELPGFDEFWQVYPRHVAKQAAIRMYRRALKSARPTDILRGAMQYAAERTGKDPTFTKHPATWLNGGCWDDEPTGSSNGAIAANPTMAAFDYVIDRTAGAAVDAGAAIRDITPRRGQGR